MEFHLIGLGKAVFIWAVALTCIPILIWFERKGAAFIQDRVGPNRAAVLGVRLAGIVHNISDVVKLLTKEMMVPAHTNKWYFTIAPFVGITVLLFAFAVVPWADNLRFGRWDIPMQVANLNGGILYILAITSLEVYGIVLAGWSSNNKFSLLGALRSSAQMISYEIPLALSLIGVFMVFGTVQLGEIVRGQGELLWGFLPRWGVFVQPLGFLIFLTAAFAEANRNPFDIPEGESEIVAGYHVEYSGIRFALFYMGEYVAIVLSAAMVTTLFFGGWQIPYLPTDRIVANASTVLRVLLTVGAVLSFVSAIVFLRYDKRLSGTWAKGDLRNQEGKILAVVAIIFFVMHLVAAIVLWSVELPEWGTAVVAVLAQTGMFVLKLLFFCWLFIWVRWTLPRFRYDQLMRLGWKNLIPLAFLNIFVTGFIILLVERSG
ncbi:MAG: NADH-quinone oxidoreductase subunit H [Candidatus Latescibacterota bacterium]|nr:MAG: NADH-quinone oxidoreductase subunit H [Candidatus Latescibacterota bacterium]